MPCLDRIVKKNGKFENVTSPLRFGEFPLQDLRVHCGFNQRHPMKDFLRF